MTNYYQLKNYTAITVKGANSKELLQGQVSCDLDEEKDHYDGLFCNEKGYVITNSTILLDEYFYILVKDEVCSILKSELNKFGKFFDCSVDEEKIDVFGQEKNGELKKFIGKKDSDLDSEDWDEVCALNFCFDINEKMSGKFRVNELGYNLNKYVSYDKGCYRGQEIIARLTYLGKKSKKAVVFGSDCQEITNSENRSIGKKIYSFKSKSKGYSQFFIEDTDFFLEGKKIIPVTSQWDLDLDQ
tara:strand:+ start:35 stop:763 length:729 start_codon:yes stop_codon:yes gene_type:complete